jgi:SAM-dependent methyltransferase
MKSLKSYNDIGNWNFSDLNIEKKKEHVWDMYEELRKCVDEKSIVLDLGTGGGERALKSIPDVGMLIGTDLYENMIKTANENLKKYPEKRARFLVMDSLKMEFPNEMFDAVVVRHTVMNAKKVYDSLKTGGHLFVEDIDKEDCIELKEEFGRGQQYGKTAQRDIDLFLLEEAGFKNIEKHEIVFDEFYDEESLIKLLIKVPIIDDYNEKREIESIAKKEGKDYEALKRYMAKNTINGKIRLRRVLCGFHAIK